MPFVLKPVFATYIDWSTVKLRSRERVKITTEKGYVYYFKLVEDVYPSMKVRRLGLDWDATSGEVLEELLDICRVQVDGNEKSTKYTPDELMTTFDFHLSGGSRDSWSSSSPEVGRHIWTMLYRRSGGIGTRLPGGRVTGIESVVLPRNFQP